MAMRSLTVLLVLLLLPFAGHGQAMPSVEASGLMKDMAVLTIDGRKQVLRVGQVSPEGVRLLAADASAARIEVAGREIELGLSARVGAQYMEPTPLEVRIGSDDRGQFRVTGLIDGRPVRFLVDTGATVLAMSSEQAARLGIDYRAGEPGRVTTASGVSPSWFLTLEEVEVGGIRVNGVRAAIVDGPFPSEALLGMSFLRHVGFAENEGVLTLLQRF